MRSFSWSFFAIPFLAICLLTCVKKSKNQDSLNLNFEGVPCVSEGQANVAVGVQDLKRLVDNLWSPTTSKEEKKLAIEQTFKTIDALCDKNCADAVTLLQNANSLLQAPQFEVMVTSKLKPILQAVGQEKIDIEAFQKGFQKLNDYFSERGSEALTLRVKASIEFIRLVVSLNDEMVLALIESKETSILARYQNDASFQEYLDSLLKQGRALSLLAEVALKFKDRTYKIQENDARVVANAINDLGFFYAKFVQSLSNLTLAFDFGDGVMEHFQKFQENLDPMPWFQVREIVKEQLGKFPEEIFIISPQGTGKNPIPLATATIGQTYKWRLKTSFRGERDVIVKVQRRGRVAELKRASELNLAVMALKDVAVAGESFAPLVDLLFQLIIGFEKSVARELDFRIEAQNLVQARAFLASQRGVFIPEPVFAYSSEKVLTMELAPGVNIEKILNERAIKFAEGAREEAFASLLDSLFYQFFAVKWMHGDLHPGNILADPNGTLSLIDWANEFSTTGLIWEPMGFLLSYFFGNANGVAQSLAKIQTNKLFKTKEFAEFAKVEMKKIGLNPIAISPELFVNKEMQKQAAIVAMDRLDFLYDKEFADKFRKTLLLLIKEAALNYAWVPTERYANLLRTAVPVLSTIGSFSIKLDKEKTKALFMSRWWRILPSWMFRYGSGRFRYLDALYRKRFVSFLEDSVDKGLAYLRGCKLKNPNIFSSDSLDDF